MGYAQNELFIFIPRLSEIHLFQLCFFTLKMQTYLYSGGYTTDVHILLRLFPKNCRDCIWTTGLYWCRSDGFYLAAHRTARRINMAKKSIQSRLGWNTAVCVLFKNHKGDIYLFLKDLKDLSLTKCLMRIRPSSPPWNIITSTISAVSNRFGS